MGWNDSGCIYYLIAIGKCYRSVWLRSLNLDFPAYFHSRNTSKLQGTPDILAGSLGTLEPLAQKKDLLSHLPQIASIGALWRRLRSRKGMLLLPGKKGLQSYL